MTSIHECPICFEKIGENSIECKNFSCDDKICFDCADTYLNISINDKLIPTCPSCKAFYLRSNFKSTPDLMTKYNKSCLLQLINDNGDQARKKYEILTVIEGLRNERKVFIEKKFPAAIALTARITMPAKLRLLDKQIKDRISDQSKKSHRICMNLTCNGSLNSELICMTCSTHFCKDCENKINIGHICKQSDIDSVKTVNDSVRCPGCNLPIIKTHGCDSITCANCKTNFTYTDGIKGGHGSYVTPIAALNTKILLSQQYHQYLVNKGLLTLMTYLEALQPNEQVENPVNKFLLNFYIGGMVEDPNLLDDLSRSYEKHILYKYRNQLYQTIVTEIENLIINDKLTLSNISNFIEKLSNLKF